MQNVVPIHKRWRYQKKSHLKPSVKWNVTTLMSNSLNNPHHPVRTISPGHNVASNDRAERAQLCLKDIPNCRFITIHYHVLVMVVVVVVGLSRASRPPKCQTKRWWRRRTTASHILLQLCFVDTMTFVCTKFEFFEILVLKICKVATARHDHNDLSWGGTSTTHKQKDTHQNASQAAIRKGKDSVLKWSFVRRSTRD